MVQVAVIHRARDCFGEATAAGDGQGFTLAGRTGPSSSMGCCFVSRELHLLFLAGRGGQQSVNCLGRSSHAARAVIWGMVKGHT